MSKKTSWGAITNVNTKTTLVCIGLAAMPFT